MAIRFSNSESGLSNDVTCTVHAIDILITSRLITCRLTRQEHCLTRFRAVTNSTVHIVCDQRSFYQFCQVSNNMDKRRRNRKLQCPEAVPLTVRRRTSCLPPCVSDYLSVLTRTLTSIEAVTLTFVVTLAANLPLPVHEYTDTALATLFTFQQYSDIISANKIL